MTQNPIMHINFEELSESINSSEELVIELIEYGIVVPSSGDQPQTWLFAANAVSVAKKAIRIHHDLTLDWADIALVLSLLEEREQLLAENNMLKQRLSRFVHDEQK